MNREEFIHNVHLRKLNQPFEWHSQGPGEEVEAEKLEKFNNSTEEVTKKISTCRNSVQGKLWIADDQGYICHRSDIASNGCCDRNSTSSLKYSCNGCTNSTGCCETFEFCVSCCMNPVNVSYQYLFRVDQKWLIYFNTFTERRTHVGVKRSQCVK